MEFWPAAIGLYIFRIFSFGPILCDKAPGLWSSVGEKVRRCVVLCVWFEDLDGKIRLD